ncbi:MAG: hypothetical protein NZM26_04285 [Patescibacteria group bacterium]|nr:hypothetical protein [Patescibacteria group bacterium]
MDDQNQNTTNDANQTIADQEKVIKDNLRTVLQVGLTIQMISVIIAFAVKKGKTDFLTKLNQLIVEMSKSLTEEEKKELQSDTNAMIEQKAEEMIKQMGESMSPEELEQAINDLKEIALQPANFSSENA